jgi:CheY-like chemotaxis protein/HPt (histidine-containing phosphotransfer) domain-containing protein
LIEELRGADGLGNLRFVIMSHAQGEQFGMINPDQVAVRDRPLKRSALIHAIAVAAGRASPELPQDVEKIGVGDHEVPSVEEARAAGQLILLAEDNPTNQDVIGRQLNRLGYQMEIADDGQIALEMWRQGSYGLLLSDCHMPNMDGYELTGAIRSAQADSGERLPIVAITANALQGEAERCLEAGMDDYLAKPVEMRLLKRMLANWLPRERSFTAGGAMPAQEPTSAPAPAASPDAASGNDAPVDPSTIKEMFGDDDELVAEILGEFVEPAANNVAEILEAWEANNAAGVAAGAHKLKSSARTIGANSMADLCTELETAGNSGDSATIVERIGELKPMYLNAKKYIDGLK